MFDTTNLQRLLSIRLPRTLVIPSWIGNRSDSRFLRGEINQIRTEMKPLRVDINHDMTTLRADLTRYTATLLDSIHRDMVSLHERVAVVEAKQQ